MASRRKNYGTSVTRATFILITVIGLQQGTAQTSKRRELTGAEIKAAFIGKIATDGVHWSHYLKADGSISAIEMGRKRIGHWAIRDAQLCVIVPARAPEECATVVRQKGKNLFLRDDMDIVEVTVEPPSAKYQLN